MRIKLLFSLLQIFIIINLINLSTNKSKKKKNKKKSRSNLPTLPNGLPTPESVRPNYVTPELFCETCRAIVKEAVKELKTKTRESDVLYYLDNVCDENKYTVYQHVPRDIKITCSTFMGVYEEELIKLLTKRKSDSTKEECAQQLCDNITEICKGVEVNLFKNMKKIDNNNTEGQPFNIEYHPKTDKDKDKDKKNKDEEKEEKKNKKKKKKKEKKERKDKKKKDKMEKSDL